MLGNSFNIENIFNQNIEYVLPHFTSKYVMIVPLGSLENMLQIMIRHNYINPTIPLVHLQLFIIAMYLRYKKERHVFLKSWKLVIFQKFDHIGTDYLDRCLKIMWVLFAMVIACSYQEYLYRNMRKPPYV